MNRIAASLIIFILWLHVSCDFESPTAFEIPTWNVGLNIPLLHEKYPLSDIISDTSDTAVIQASGDTIFIDFAGELPEDSVNASYTQMPLDLSVSFADTTQPPGGFFTGFDFTLSDTIPVGALIDGIIPNLADLPNLVTLPSPDEQKIIGSAWNEIAQAVESTMGGIDTVFTLYDTDEVFGEITFFQLLGIIIGDPDSTNFYHSLIENVDLPVNIETSTSSLISGVDTLALHDTTNISFGGKLDKTTSLVNKMLGEAVGIEFGFTLERVGESDTVTIAPNTNLDMVLEIGISIQNLDDARVDVNEYILPTDLDPIEFSNAAYSAEDCEVSGVYGGTFQSGTPDVPKTNIIGMSNVRNTYPFSLDFEIKFKNFVNTSTGDTLTFAQTLTSGSVYEEEKKLDGMSFINPDDPDPNNPTIPLESFIVEPVIKTIQDTVDIPLDGEDGWIFSLGVDVSDLDFSSLKADLDCSFPPQTQEIAGVPTGFEGMSFGEVILQFTMYNQIKLPLYMDLTVKGYSTTGDSVRVFVNADLGVPQFTGDTAKTFIQLSSIGTVVNTYTSASDPEPSVSDTIFATDTTNTILDLLTLNPSEIVVDANAGIRGFGALEDNAKFWGEYYLLAPFSVRMDTMIFIPVNSTALDEFPHDTRSRMRNAIQELTMTSRIINGLPVGGELAILLSNRDVFPLDRKLETLEMMRDSLGWPSTDELYIVNSCSTLTPSNPDMYIFSLMNDSSECVDGVAYLIRSGNPDSVFSFVDTLFKIILPDPVSLVPEGTDPPPTPGMVDVPGDTVAITGLDTNRVALLTSLGDKFITTRTQLNGTEGNVVFFSMRDTLEIKSFMTFELQSSGLFESSEDELIITFPNGGEEFQIGETVTVTWRSLGENIGSSNVKLFSSTGSNPDVSENEIWTSITEESIENTDSYVWNLESADVSDSLWLRICNESETVCDRSGYFIGVTNGGNQNPGGGLAGQMTNSHSIPIYGSRKNDKNK